MPLMLRQALLRAALIADKNDMVLLQTSHHNYPRNGD
jgi:hypothetical protein